MNIPSQRTLTQRFRLGIGLAILITVVAVLSYIVFHYSPIVPQRLAGGSATGNAISVAEKSTWVGTTITHHDSVITLSVPEPAASLCKPIIAPAATIHDVQTKDADSTLKAWLTQHNIAYTRLIHFAPSQSFLDTSIILGGLQPGDLVVYSEGNYTQTNQFPSVDFQAKKDAPLTLMAMPSNHVRLQLPHGFHFHSAAYWHLLGLELQAMPSEAQVIELQGSKGMRIENCTLDSLPRGPGGLEGVGISGSNNQNLSLEGNAFGSFMHSIVLSEDSTDERSLGALRVQGNHLGNGSMVLTRLKTDSVIIDGNVAWSEEAPIQLNMIAGSVTLRNNVLIGSGRGTLVLQGTSALIESNSLWNRHAVTNDLRKDLIQFTSTSTKQSVAFVRNKILDESGAIMAKSNAQVLFHDNQMFVRGTPMPSWLQTLNQILDPGFATAQ